MKKLLILLAFFLPFLSFAIGGDVLTSDTCWLASDFGDTAANGQYTWVGESTPPGGARAANYFSNGTDFLWQRTDDVTFVLSNTFSESAGERYYALCNYTTPSCVGYSPETPYAAWTKTGGTAPAGTFSESPCFTPPTYSRTPDGTEFYSPVTVSVSAETFDSLCTGTSDGWSININDGENNNYGNVTYYASTTLSATDTIPLPPNEYKTVGINCYNSPELYPDSGNDFGTVIEGTDYSGETIFTILPEPITPLTPFSLFMNRLSTPFSWIFGGFLLIAIVYLFFSILEGYRIWIKNHRI